jgi:hypothetical protein
VKFDGRNSLTPEPIVDPMYRILGGANEIKSTRAGTVVGGRQPETWVIGQARDDPGNQGDNELAVCIDFVQKPVLMRVDCAIEWNLPPGKAR